jgi:hypothetical protein
MRRLTAERRRERDRPRRADTGGACSNRSKPGRVDAVKKIPEAVLILSAGVVGILIRGFAP